MASQVGCQEPGQTEFGRRPHVNVACVQTMGPEFGLNQWGDGHFFRVCAGQYRMATDLPCDVLTRVPTNKNLQFHMHSCSTCVLKKQKMRPRWAAFFESNSTHEQATAGRCLLGAATLCHLARVVIAKSKGTDQIVHGPVDDLIESYRNSDNTVDGP